MVASEKMQADKQHMTGSLRASAPIQCESPLKVYMYDLPRRFNFGMLKKNSSQQNLPWTSSIIPPWPQRSGLKKQHSVEYWMMVYLLDQWTGGEGERAAVRVKDPEQADVFFVPFFASLSFNVHGQTMRDPETEIDRQMQIELVDMLRRSKSWQRSGGRDHVIAIHHPNAFRFLRDEVNASIFVVADFGRYPRAVSYLSKDVVAPYVHVVDSYLNDEPFDPFDSRKILLFFRGKTKRKDEGIVRLKLAKLLGNHNRVYFEDSIATNEGFEAMKSDTAHRRIYDIANVYEGAGLITRSPESRPKEFGVITAHRDEFYDSAFKKEIRLRKPEIHLLTSFRSGEQLPSHKETLCGPLKRNKDRLCSLQKEKASALLRLKAKKADYDLLKDEYALAKEWILYNQKRATNKAVQKDRRDDCSNSNVENAFLHPPFTLLAAQPHTNVDILMDFGLDDESDSNSRIFEVEMTLDDEYILRIIQ